MVAVVHEGAARRRSGAGAAGARGAAPATGLAPGLDPNAVALQGAPANAGGGAGGQAQAPAAAGAAGGRGGAGGGGAGGGAPAAPNCMLSTAAANGGGGGRGGGAPAAPQPGLPFIGPSANGNILVAWNPVTQKEAWRGPANSAAGYNQGGTLTTRGNLVFASVTGCLLAFKADTGEQVLGLATGLPASPGPPMTFMLDGKQYIAVAGAIGGGGGRGGGGGGGAPAAAPAAGAPGAQGAPAGGVPPLPGGAPAVQGGGRGAAAPTGPQPSQARLLMLVLDGKPLTQ